MNIKIISVYLQFVIYMWTKCAKTWFLNSLRNDTDGIYKKIKISFFAQNFINDLFSWETNVPRSELCYIIEERYDKSRESKPQQSN